MVCVEEIGWYAISLESDRHTADLPADSNPHSLVTSVGMPTAVKKLFNVLRHRGFLEIVGLARKNLAHRYRLYLDRKFDRCFGTETSGRIALNDLSVVGGNRDHGVYFESTPTALFNFFMSNVTVDPARFTFIDLGSGKGRCLLLASNYAFAQIIGVEFSQELHESAVKNISIYQGEGQRCRRVESVNQDASTFEFPEEPLFIYAYNPFDEKLMSAVLERLVKSLECKPRDVVMVYFNPRSWVMGRFCQLPLRAWLKVPYDPTREVQRPAAAYANFALSRTAGWRE